MLRNIVAPRTIKNAYKVSSLTSIRCKTTEEPAPDEPIKYTTSAAYNYKASQTRAGYHNEEAPWYQGYVISGSLAVFMLYFFVLREENDIDRELDKSLYSRIDGLEEKQLQIVLDYNRSRNLETKNIEQRLEEIRQQKLQAKS